MPEGGLPEQKAITKMPFTCEERDPKRFDGDFELRPAAGYAPNSAEKAYVAKLESVLEDLFADSSRGSSDGETGAGAKTAAAKHFFDEAVRSLKSDADEFCDGRLSPEFAADNALVFKGRYKGLRGRLDQRLFTVTPIIDSESKLATDIHVEINPDLPGQENLPSPQKQELFNAMATTSSVISAVHHRTLDNVNRKRWWRGSNDQAKVQKTAAANRLLDEFMRKLVGIGQVGLEGPHADLGKLALADLRNQYVSRVAAGIKNNYVRSLGWACFFAAALLLSIHTCIKLEFGFVATDFWQDKKNFFLLTAGSAVGTWLSFSIRRVTLAFEELAVLEEDLLDPILRVLFVMGLTSLVGLLFWTGAVNLEVGDMKTISFKISGSISLLAGAFCGIAERSLATAISGRAAALVKGVAGG
jgi:hypothetical protein